MEAISDHFLHKFFYPESIAVIGSSGNPQRIGYNLFGNLVKLGYQGRMYPVNPKEKEILGIKSYARVQDIEEIVDLAVIGVSQEHTPAVLRQCIEKGIKRVVLVAGGFSEIGQKGKRIQRELLDLVRKNGVRAIGPNALSPINSAINMAISFQPLDELRTGGLSLIFQSGLYEPRIRWLFSECNFRLSKLIDLGNKMDLNEVDALSYLVFDPQTRIIGIHLESIAGDPLEFAALVRKATALGKRVIVLKSGRTMEGARAAASHTGAMVQGSDAIFDTVVKQCGALRADTIEEFFDVARALERFGSLFLKGNRIAVAALSGGEEVVMTDLVQREGMQMAKVAPTTLAKLKSIFPPWEIGANPFDLGVSVQFNDPVKVYETLIPALSEDENVDVLHVQIPDMIINLPRDNFSVFNSVTALHKPIVLWSIGAKLGSHETLQWLEDHQIPVFDSPEKALRAVAALRRLSLRVQGFKQQ